MSTTSAFTQAIPSMIRASFDEKAALAGPPVVIPEGNYRIYPKIAPNSDLDDKDVKTDDGNPMQIWLNGNHQNNQWFHLTSSVTVSTGWVRCSRQTRR